MTRRFLPSPPGRCMPACLLLLALVALHAGRCEAQWIYWTYAGTEPEPAKLKPGMRIGPFDDRTIGPYRASTPEDAAKPGIKTNYLPNDMSGVSAERRKPIAFEVLNWGGPKKDPMHFAVADGGGTPRLVFVNDEASACNWTLDLIKQDREAGSKKAGVGDTTFDYGYVRTTVEGRMHFLDVSAVGVEYRRSGGGEKEQPYTVYPFILSDKPHAIFCIRSTPRDGL